MEAVGGTVTCVHFNKLALRAFVETCEIRLVPTESTPEPVPHEVLLGQEQGWLPQSRDSDAQLQLFGTEHITSEERKAEEHTKFTS